MKHNTYNWMMCTILFFLLIMFTCQNINESFNFNLVSDTIQSKVIDSQKKIKKLKYSII